MTWIELVAEHEQLLVGLASVAGIAATGLAYALVVVRRGGRAGRAGSSQARR